MSKEAEIETFVSTLTSYEKVIFDLAVKARERIIVGLDFQGACYHVTYLLHMILKREYQVDSDVIIGFVNDGTDDVMISHGWLEYKGRKVDIAISNPSYGQRPGCTLVLDHVIPVRAGSPYSYHRSRGEKGELRVRDLMATGSPRVQELIRRKELEHQYMLHIQGSEVEIMKYLNSAPAGMGYDYFFNLLKS